MKNNKRTYIAIGTVIVIIILLLLLKCCTGSDGPPTIIEDKPTLLINNMNDLENIFERADLCSEEWFEDYDKYIEDLEEQIGILKKEDSIDYTDAIKAQEELLRTLKEFREVQDEININEVEKEFKEYREVYKQYTQGSN